MPGSLAIVDSGGANIASLLFALERLGITATLTADAARIRAADRVILPGVGAAADAMERLKKQQLTEVIAQLTQPVLGICLGMQLLAQHSAEQDTPCLGILPLTATKLPATTTQPVPNMGWCKIDKLAEHPLLAAIPDGSYFYFVHSYALPPSALSLANASHAQDFCAVAAQRNFYAAQFHPERSQVAGAQLLRNFARLPA